MQWDDSVHAGFTNGEPWIKVNPNHKEINAKAECKDENSIFHYYKKLIQLRKTNKVLVDGKYELLLEEHPQIFAYTRTLGEETILVIANFYDDMISFSMPTNFQGSKKQLISNYNNQTEGMLQPYEAAMYLI